MVLDEIKKEIKNKSFKIEKEFEDVHSKIEYFLTNRFGEVGKKVHTARSRNDQVLVAMHLYVKKELSEIKTKIIKLFDLLHH